MSFMSHSQRVPSEVNRSARNVHPQPRPQNRPMEGRLYLRDEELDAGAAIILGAEKRLARAMQGVLKDAPINQGELDVLMGIRAVKGLTVRQMRERLAMTVPTFARILGQLDQKGLIGKTPSNQDMRARVLELSDKGETLIAPFVARLRDVLRTAYRDTGAEHVAGARAVLEAIIAHEDGDD